MAAQPGHVDIVKLLLHKGADATVQQVYGRTAFDYAAETTSFVMLHSPLDRLQKREEACRILYPHLSKKQQGGRSLTERKAIVIAQVPAVVEPGARALLLLLLLRLLLFLLLAAAVVVETCGRAGTAQQQPTTASTVCAQCVAAATHHFFLSLLLVLVLVLL